MSISKRLSTLIGLLILMVSLALGVLSINVSSEIVTDDTEAWMLNEAEIGAGLAASYIQNYFTLLQVLADMQRVRTMDREIQRGALFPYIAGMGVDDLAVIDMEGNAWHLRGGQTVNLAERPYVQKALSGQWSLSEFIPATGSAVSTGFPLLNYVVPIKVNGRVAGALLARTNALVLSDLIKIVKTRGSGYAYMINAQGQIVAHATRQEAVMNLDSPIEMAKTNASLQPAAVATQYFLDQKQGVTTYELNKKHMICTFAPVPGFDMFLILSAERESLMGSVYFLRNLIIVIVAFLWASAFWRRFSSPVPLPGPCPVCGMCCTSSVRVILPRRCGSGARTKSPRSAFP